ncbi:hypothetical protein OG730_00910 [Streptomyces sp. NBC_01298]|uniref:hypothetical protein n=1 Tax=Streptomyces sp. NBC_01298 TaxID=2903817 RepID=UPI002E0E63D1|nr:hypothetical protein OG730_00910 [Streptomyces sp. NBC_01298]
MITLSVDTTSQAYATGQSVGALLVTAVAVVCVWFATRAWRRGPVPTSAVEVERAGALAVRRSNIVRGALLVVAAAGLVQALSFEGEPSAAEAAPVSQAPADAGGSPPAERVIDAAAEVGAYRLLTGAEAAEYAELTSGKAPSGKRWFYDGPGEGPVGAVLQINTVEWDARLAKEKRSDTMSQELRNFFAGARATEVTTFDAGSWGGKLSCGFLPNAGHQIVCAWTDSGTSGSLLLADEQDLPKASEIARQFRTASEQRT